MPRAANLPRTWPAGLYSIVSATSSNANFLMAGGLTSSLF